MCSRSRDNRKAFRLTTVAILSCLGLHAEAVKLSFLGDESALADTQTVLTNNGCSEAASANFHQVVFDYFTKDFDIDLSKFPKSQKGFYSFTTMEELIAALPREPFGSNHPVGFNCYATVILLGQDQLKTSLLPDEISGPFLVPNLNTNSQPPSFIPCGAATARNAFVQLYPPACADAAVRFMPDSMRDSLICLSAALFQCYPLPFSAQGEVLSGRSMDVLRQSWRRNGIRFPSRFQLVQMHGVRSALLCTEHAGVLFRRDRGYTYIEKNGVSGPFVRLDCEGKSDVMLWLAALWKGCKLHDSHFVTINDTEMGDLKSSKK